MLENSNCAFHSILFIRFVAAKTSLISFREKKILLGKTNSENQILRKKVGQNSEIKIK